MSLRIKSWKVVFLILVSVGIGLLIMIISGRPLPLKFTPTFNEDTHIEVLKVRFPSNSTSSKSHEPGFFIGPPGEITAKGDLEFMGGDILHIGDLMVWDGLVYGKVLDIRSTGKETGELEFEWYLHPYPR